MGAEISQDANPPPADGAPPPQAAHGAEGRGAAGCRTLPSLSTVRRSTSSSSLNVSTTLNDPTAAAMHDARHDRRARAATWQHRGQRRRAYLNTPWQGRGGSGCPSAHSDTDSEGGQSESSCSGMKRTFTESDCSGMEEEMPHGAGGTWPRAIKRNNSSQRSLTECVNLWDVSRELAREKQDLSAQLRQVAGGGRGDSMPNFEMMNDKKLAADLQKLVEQAGHEKLMRERLGAEGISDEDGMVDAILGAMLADSNSPTSTQIASAAGLGPSLLGQCSGSADDSNQRQLYQLGRQLGQMLSQSGQLAESSHMAQFEKGETPAASSTRNDAADALGFPGEQLLRAEVEASLHSRSLESSAHAAMGEREASRDANPSGATLPSHPGLLSSAQLEMSDSVYDGIFGDVFGRYPGCIAPLSPVHEVASPMVSTAVGIQPDHSLMLGPTLEDMLHSPKDMLSSPKGLLYDDQSPRFTELELDSPRILSSDLGRAIERGKGKSSKGRGGGRARDGTSGSSGGGASDGGTSTGLSSNEAGDYESRDDAKRDNSHGNRKEWSLLEDQMVVDGVRRSGCRWRQIAAMLPGRSDDAVRNRWNRLKEAEITGSSLREPGQTGGGAPYHCSKCGQIKKNHRCTAIEGTSKEWGELTAHVERRAESKKKPERVGWTRMEDAIITQSVEELGHRWYHIAERLPGRTDHAIRNRWHRLQSMRNDALQVTNTPEGTSDLSPAASHQAHDEHMGMSELSSPHAMPFDESPDGLMNS